MSAKRNAVVGERAKSAVFAAVLLLAAAAFSFAQSNTPEATAAPSAAEVWTCSMHPQVRLPAPGKCPICSMPLIRANAVESSASGGPLLNLTNRAATSAGVETVPVERREITRELRVVGKVQYNERALATVTTRVDGYIERLFVDFTGVEVHEGDHLVEIWSPELLIAQGELFSEMRSPSANVTPGARLKLQRLGMTPQQVDELVSTRKATDRVTLVSPITGTVIEKMVSQKSSVKAGDTLYRVANLDSVWVYLDIYEYELPWVRYGQTVEITSEAFPGVISGRVWFINPVVTDESRTVKVLVNIPNEQRKLKPGMFVSATIRAKLLANGEAAPTGVEGQWTCPMHTQVLLPERGECPICKMPLVQIPGEPRQVSSDEARVLAVPVTAVLDSGIRRLVYVERQPGKFAAVEVKLGPRAGEFFPVIEGLKEGDRVATRGNFLLDSQAQISGLPSLFNASGQAPAPAHQHGETPQPTATPTEHKH